MSKRYTTGQTISGGVALVISGAIIALTFMPKSGNGIKFKSPLQDGSKKRIENVIDEKDFEEVSISELNESQRPQLGNIELYQKSNPLYLAPKTRDLYNKLEAPAKEYMKESLKPVYGRDY